MQVIYGKSQKKWDMGPTGIGLGNFDGLHIGHMNLINTLISESRLCKLHSMVYTFSKHPENIIRKKLITSLLLSEDKKIQLLGETSLDYLYFDEFNEEFSRIDPERFVYEVLVNRLNIKLAVAGFNYRFGYMGQGDVELLKKMGRLHGFNVIIIPPVKIENEIISSTIIRSYISKGDMEKVFKLLGRHYSISGKVQSGKCIGNKLGFPTANIYPKPYLVLPNSGVYITRTRVGDEFFYSVTNIGWNPTFGKEDQVSVETHILDFEKNIYGKNIEVYFITRLREERKFNSEQELLLQLHRDIAKCREYSKTD